MRAAISARGIIIEAYGERADAAIEPFRQYEDGYSHDNIMLMILDEDDESRARMERYDYASVFIFGEKPELTEFCRRWGWHEVSHRYGSLFLCFRQFTPEVIHETNWGGILFEAAHLTLEQP